VPTGPSCLSRVTSAVITRRSAAECNPRRRTTPVVARHVTRARDRHTATRLRLSDGNDIIIRAGGGGGGRCLVPRAQLIGLFNLTCLPNFDKVVLLVSDTYIYVGCSFRHVVDVRLPGTESLSYENNAYDTRAYDVAGET